MIDLKIRKNKGFTLIEMLISMSIFIVFTGVLIGSYSSVVRAQRNANEYRVMYVEARRVFETLIQDFRDSSLDYLWYGEAPILNQGEVSVEKPMVLISKDGSLRTQIYYDQLMGVVSVQKSVLQINQQASSVANYVSGQKLDLNSPEQVKVSEFKIYVSPSVDPYSSENVEKNNVQFQPMMTIYAKFERDFASGKSYEMDLQTSVSSRIYSQVYQKKNN